MSLRNRILLMVTVLLVLAVLATALTLTWTARQALLQQMDADGKVIAQLLARSAAFAVQVPGDVEDAIGDQMVVEATIASHLVAIAEQMGMSADEINQHLEQITQDSTLDEFWITDERGHAYLTNVDVDFTFSADEAEQPQAYVFWDLLTGEKQVVEQEARVREIDQQTFKYVGVGGIDRARIVQVGYNLSFLNELREQFGVTRLTQELVSGGDIIAIRVLDSNFLTLAYSAVPEARENLGSDKHSRGLMLQAMNEKRTVSDVSEGILKVVAPVLNIQNEVIGVTMVLLPTDQVQATVQRQVRWTTLVASLALGIGVFASIFLAKREMEPVEKISRAALDVEAGEFEPQSLAAIGERQDDLGKLAQTFTRMAVEVQAREKRLRQQVEALRIEIDEQKKEREVAEITESEYFVGLQEKAREIRRRRG
jgi:adenylate cyclase